VDIVQRGKRRARLQVVGASVAAVVLIAAVALGATVLGRLGASDRVSTAGPSTSLPVTSQTVTTTNPNLPPPSSYYADAACIYPALNSPSKWLPLNAKQVAQFISGIGSLELSSMRSVTPVLAQRLPPNAVGGAESVELSANGRSTLVTLSTSFYFGSQAVAAQLDSRQTDMPGDCVASVQLSQMGRALINEYSPPALKLKGIGDAPMFLRAQVYSSSGIRYDLTEVTNADDLIGGPSVPESATSPPTANLGAGASGASWASSPMLPASQLATIAFQVASQG
ncbi:MAG TPA: hypothetical protein VGM75_10430, partial [Pseudonocardiaceae bacterium]